MKNSFEIKFVIPVLKKNSLPGLAKPQDADLYFYVDGIGSLSIQGNSKGLLYLAEWLAIMASINNDEGLHLHLFEEDGDIDTPAGLNAFKSLTIHNSDFYKYRTENNDLEK